MLGYVFPSLKCKSLTEAALPWYPSFRPSKVGKEKMHTLVIAHAFAQKHHMAVYPPSIGSATPVTYAASSLARKTAHLATSSGFPHSFHGVMSVDCAAAQL